MQLAGPRDARTAIAVHAGTPWPPGAATWTKDAFSGDWKGQAAQWHYTTAPTPPVILGRSYAQIVG
jgi:hypothetical protein